MHNGYAIQLEADRREWDAFVDASPGGTVYHKACWRDIQEAAFGHQSHYLFARSRGGALIGVLPIVRLRSLLFGDFLVSVPAVNYGGALAVSPDVEQGLMREASRIGQRMGVSHIEFRDPRPRGGDWVCRTDKVIMELDLPREVETLWRGLGTKLRNKVRRPFREKADVMHGGAELLDDFYSVFARNMRDLGTPVYSRRLFELVLGLLGPAASLLVVRIGSQAVAGGLLISYGGRMEIPWGASVREYNRVKVNMLLYWEALKKAIEEGHAVFDFGRCSKGSGSYEFKSQWGARPRQAYWHYWLREGRRPPSLNPGNPKYQRLIKIWQRLPVQVANLLGPPIVKKLP